MDIIVPEIIFIYNNDDDYKAFGNLDTKGYAVTYYDLRKTNQYKLAYKYLKMYKQQLVPFILIYTNKELTKMFIQTETQDAISDLNRYLHNSPPVEKLNQMFEAFINKCKNHELNKQEVLNLINKMYE